MAVFDGEQARESGHIESECAASPGDSHLQSPLGLREPRAATGGDRQQTVGNQPIDRDVVLNLPASELIVEAGIICVKTASSRSVSRRVN